MSVPEVFEQAPTARTPPPPIASSHWAISQEAIMTNRREFLQTNAAIAGSVLLPKSVFATTPDPNFHFIHTDTLNSWPVTDPVQWSIQHAHEPVLAHAAGLSKLTTSDGDRIIRLVVRRCSLNLLEVQLGRIVVDHWGPNRADLSPFFKTHGLARPEIEVVLRDRKNETATTLTGDSFLYGVPLASSFDLELLQSKWRRRFENDADDWQAASGTSSGLAWYGLPDGSIPWAALKSAWRGAGVVCQNCSGEALLVNFGLRQVGVFNHSGFVEHVCGACRRSSRDSVDVKAWMAANLDEVVPPVAEMVWRVKWEAKNGERCSVIL